MYYTLASSKILAGNGADASGVKLAQSHFDDSSLSVSNLTDLVVLVRKLLCLDAPLVLSFFLFSI